MNMIEVSHLKKSYGNLDAVSDISFHVEEGELFGFLGINGAGKSTTIHMLCTLFPPTAGTASICGIPLGTDDAEIRRSIGIVAQQNSLDDLLSVYENLMIRGSLYESNRRKVKEQIAKVSEVLELKQLWKRPFGKLSGGQKRRCEIARALLHAPKILFLDEPTTGLDPATRKAVWECIATLQKKLGMTVFLTTHYMEEAANADHIAIIDHGKLMEYGTPDSLKETYARDRLVMIPIQEYETDLESWLQQHSYLYQQRDGKFFLLLNSSLDAIALVTEVRPYLQGFEVLRGTMDDVFLTVTGKKLKDGGE